MKKKNTNVLNKKLKDKISKLNNPKIKKLYKLFKSKLSKILGKQKIAVGVSGGADSLCLAYFCYLYSLEFKNKINFFIVNHKIRKNSSIEANKVKKILNLKGIKSTILTWKGKKPIRNIQANARDIRYSLISKQCTKFKINYLLIAHHQDDQIENFFMRLMRGSGLKGLSSMNDMYNYSKHLTIVRPLLFTEKKDLKYVTQKIFKTYIQDPSNKDDIFFRSRVRKYINIFDKEGFDTKKVIRTIKNLKIATNALDFYKNKAIKKYIKFKNKNTCFVKVDILKLESEEIIFRTFSDIFASISEKYYPPRSKKLINFINKLKTRSFKKSNLANCVAEKSKDYIVIRKDNIK